MKYTNLKKWLEVYFYIVGSAAIVLFLLTFFFGWMDAGLSYEGRESMCDRANLNIERLWPVKAGCWAWKETE